MTNNDQPQKDIMVLLRQVEILKAQIEVVQFALVELARHLGIQVIEAAPGVPAAQAPGPKAPK